MKIADMDKFQILSYKCRMLLAISSLDFPTYLRNFRGRRNERMFRLFLFVYVSSLYLRQKQSHEYFLHKIQGV